MYRKVQLVDSNKKKIHCELLIITYIDIDSLSKNTKLNNLNV